MHRFLSRIRQRAKDRKGQGLVEYALILVLVSIIVIAILTLFGDAVANSYCSVVYALNQTAKPPKICHSPMVTCKVTNWTAATFNLEAVIYDPDETDPTRAQKVEFYRGTIDGTPDINQTSYKYCMGTGTTTCNPHSETKGTVITAIAYDGKGHTGRCSVTVP